MGTQRLPTLPDTAPWRNVIAEIAENASVPEVAKATTQAALAGISLAKDDRGLASVVLVLIRLVRAARVKDFPAALDHAGLAVDGSTDLFAVLAAFTNAVDRKISHLAGRTDFGEIAQLSAIEALTSRLCEGEGGLFASAADDVRGAVRACSTPAGFGRLTYEFFACFTQRFLAYHLGRELSLHVGGDGRFPDVRAHDAFIGQLGVHCREAVAILGDYPADWYSKLHFQGEADDENVQRFVAYALTKIEGELSRRGARDG